MRRGRAVVLAGAAAVTLGAAVAWALVARAPQGPAPRSPTPAGVRGVVRAVPVAEGLEHPWGLAFLPDGRMLVTERPGRLRVVGRDGALSAPVRGVPAVQHGGQGGLLDVAVAPDFERSRGVYLSYAEPGEGGAGTAVARGRLAADDAALEDVRVVWRQVPKVEGSLHWGSRLVFTPDGKLFVTVGDRYSERPRVQDLSFTIGKVVRLLPDGGIPQDNPFVKQQGARPEVWSYGHRNVQAAALHPRTGRLFTVEHGARGGDELNSPEAGKNYGWPVITYGVDYSGVRIGEGAARPRMEQPLYYWDPVIAPSGAAFYTGAAFPEWKENLFVGSLQAGGLVRLVLDGQRVVKEERHLTELGERIRDVVQGPDGLLYLLTDSPEGQVLRVERAATPSPVKAAP